MPQRTGLPAKTWHLSHSRIFTYMTPFSLCQFLYPLWSGPNMFLAEKFSRSHGFGKAVFH